MSDSLYATTVRLAGPDGADIEAYLATPDDDRSHAEPLPRSSSSAQPSASIRAASGRGGVVVIHHLPGYDRATKEMVRRFAELGYDALCPNLYSRQAPGADPADAAAAVRAAGGIADEQLVADVEVAAAYLRGLPHSNGKVGVIGHCSGGRHSVLAACQVDVDAAVDCYGAFVTGTPGDDYPLNVTNLVPLLPGLRAPLLGLFGKNDKFPSQEQVAELDEILSTHDKPHTFFSYDDAGHAFFAVDRPSYSVAAANDGWERIETFFGEHLGA